MDPPFRRGEFRRWKVVRDIVRVIARDGVRGLRPMRNKPVDIGPMNHEERNRYLFGIKGIDA
jgi:hypothetical protein